MKKMMFLLISILLIVLILALDYSCSKFLEMKPFISYVKNVENGKVYNSLLYKVFYCTKEDGSYERHFKNMNTDFTCPKVIQEEAEYTIVDDVTVCSSVYEIFFEDDNYICEYDCLKSENVFLVYTNGTKISVKDAVQHNIEPIDDLILKGVPCTKK